jgi:hypothetical protein
VLFLIAGCEIGFWVVVTAGLVARYPMRSPRAGGALLAALPLIDLVLLAVTAVHLRSGATATTEHGLAAIYLGFTLAYGRRLVAWADVRFAHRYAGGAAPAALHGKSYTLKCWGDVLRTVFAALITAGLIMGLQRWIDDRARTSALEQFFPLLGIICAVELIWALSYTVWPKAVPRERASRAQLGRRE